MTGRALRIAHATLAAGAGPAAQEGAESRSEQIGGEIAKARFPAGNAPLIGLVGGSDRHADEGARRHPPPPDRAGARAPGGHRPVEETAEDPIFDRVRDLIHVGRPPWWRGRHPQAGEREDAADVAEDDEDPPGPRDSRLSGATGCGG